jgi:iron complex outermembrane recepter protein
MRVRKLVALALAGTAMVIVAPAAQAQVNGTRDFDMPSQDLGIALRSVAQQSGMQIIAPAELVAGLRAPALKGRYRPDQAVSQLLRGSRLKAVTVGSTLVVQRDVDPEGNESVENESEVLVTGTRIRGKGPVGVPVITLDREAIANGGFSTTQQIVQSIPQNFGGGANETTSGLLTAAGNGNVSRGSGVNLRGLGATSTLVLINGDRPPLGGVSGTFADISVIPASIIERIEVVPDGSSAIYGSDAVAGVVNIVPRLNFKGAETSFRVGTADGDFQEYQFSQLFGTGWSSGHVVVAYEFYNRTRLAASDRAYATEDLRPFGGPDRRSIYSNPGTIVAGGTTFAIPSGQDGRGLTAAQLIAGTANRGDSYDGVDLLPEQRRHSAFVALSQDLLPTLRLYAHGLATWRNYDQALAPLNPTRRTVPITNAFYVDPIGTRQPVGINYSFVRDLGNERYRGRVRAITTTAGVEATLGRWTVDAHGSWGQQREENTILNRVNSARLALALADPNPATAYNLFGDGAVTNPATIEAIRGYSERSYDGIVWAATLRADGPLFPLPAGDVRLAVGGEYREDRYRDFGGVAYVSALTPTRAAPAPLPGKRVVKGVYAELLLPVFGDDAQLPLVKRLDLSAAVRAEDYSDFGRTTNPKLGFTWEPVGGVKLRGSFGKSFRAPIFDELRQDPDSIGYFAYPAPDPQSPTGTSNILVLRGNDPDLTPERATTWTLGMDLTPAAVPGLRAGLTWFNVDYRDRIGSVATRINSFLVDRDIYAPVSEPNPSPARVNEIFDSPYYLDLAGIPRNAPFVAVVDARLTNLSVVKQSGLDLDIGYGFGLGGGRAEIGGQATYIFHINQQLTETSQAIDVVDLVGSPIDLRVRAHAGWSKGGLSANLYANYADGYRNQTVTPTVQVSSWTTFDLTLGYEFASARGPLQGLTVALTGSNLFDRDPPRVSYVVGLNTSGYDGENASPYGRVAALQVTKKW